MCMSFWTQLGATARRLIGVEGVGNIVASISDDRILEAIQGQRRDGATVDLALSLSTVYRAIQIHAAAASQLPIRVERRGARIETPAIIDEPCFAMDQSEWMEYLVTSMYTRGEAFLRIVRAPANARIPYEPLELIPVNPDEVQVHPHRTTNGNDLPDTYTWRGQEFTASTMAHLKYMIVPGYTRGLGPLQAAAVEVQGAIDARDYGARWMTETGMPEGILSMKAEAAPDVARANKYSWYGLMPDGTPMDPDGKLPKRAIKVLSGGATFEPLLLKPADVQFLDSQQFTTTQIARLFGVPASLLLAAVEGNSQTYANVEQDWIGYARFGLALATRKIDAALSRILPRGQKARVDFAGLLRTDTKTRYESHEIALRAGFMTPDEVRAIESMPALTDEQRAALRPTETEVPA